MATLHRRLTDRSSRIFLFFSFERIRKRSARTRVDSIGIPSSVRKDLGSKSWKQVRILSSGRYDSIDSMVDPEGDLLKSRSARSNSPIAFSRLTRSRYERIGKRVVSHGKLNFLFPNSCRENDRYRLIGSSRRDVRYDDDDFVLLPVLCRRRRVPLSLGFFDLSRS